MRTDLSGHKQVGKTLLPPFAQFLKPNASSWFHRRIPDMLWAVVLVGTLDRDRALSTFRKLAKAIQASANKSNFGDIRLTALAKMEKDKVIPILTVLLEDPAAHHVLKSLLVLDSLPGKELWTTLLGGAIQSDESWTFLTQSVGKVLWHQSQEATDCRWMRLLAMMMADCMKLPNEDIVKKLLLYPNHYDQKEVRPMIRAAEGAFSSLLDGPDSASWADAFWSESLRRTSCYTLCPKPEVSPIEAGTTIQRLTEVWNALGTHSMKTLQTTAPDAKHDIVFGMGFYALALLRELVTIGNSPLIIARLGLRTLLESYVTLKYLIAKNKPELWESFRVYGSGQAKLTYLKLKDLDEPPKFISIDNLDFLANEDIWDEFLKIDLGHWENSNLRRMSVEAQAKDIYDSYYPWTSAFIHAHWGAIRDAVFDTCMNPLHRLHRVPRQSCRSLPDVVFDACKLTDDILTAVDSCYRGFPDRVTMRR